MIDGLKPYPTLKDTGVRWVGSVPRNWNVVPLARVGQLFKGRGASKEDEVAEGIPCVRYGDLYTRHEFFIRSTKAHLTRERAAAYTPIQFGDVLFAASGETHEDIGRSAVNLMRAEARCGGDVLLLRPSVEVEPKFLGYATDAAPSRNQKASMGRGFTVVHLYASELKHLELAIPPLPEQSAIVRFLDHADRRIRRYIGAKKKLIKLLEEQKQAIVHRAVTRGLDPTVRLRPSGVEWLVDVPAHWQVARLGRVIELLTGFPFKSEGFTQAEGDVRLLRGVNISPGKIRWTQVVRWSESDRESFEAFELRVGDIVLGMDRPLIRGGIRIASIQECDLPALLLQRVARIRPKNELNAQYLILLLACKTFAEYLTPIFTGISVPHLSPEQIKAFRFGLPSLDEQSAIVAGTEAGTRNASAAVSTAHREIELLHEYRTRLIADVVTGKLDVREAAARLPDEAEGRETRDEASFLADVDEAATDDLDAVPEEDAA